MELQEYINNHVIIQLEDESIADDCPVCLEQMSSRWITLKPLNRNVTLKPCKHQFCQTCVLTIVEGLGNGENLRCPLCRQNVEVKSIQFSLLSRIAKWMSKEENLEMAFICLFAFLAFSALIVVSVLVWMILF